MNLCPLRNAQRLVYPIKLYGDKVDTNISGALCDHSIADPALICLKRVRLSLTTCD